MKSKISKSVAAAVVIIGIMFFLCYNNNTGAVWGRVLSDMEKFPTVIYISATESISDVNQTTSIKAFTTNYHAGENGFRVDWFNDNQLLFQLYEIPKENLSYTIDHDQKEYYIEKLDIPMKKPQEWAKEILSADYTYLGKSKINGTIVEGIEARKTELIDGEDTVIRLWVDVKTNLPMKIEYETTLSEGVKDSQQIYTRVKQVDENFQWDIELDPEMFEPNIPADYKLDER